MQKAADAGQERALLLQVLRSSLIFAVTLGCSSKSLEPAGEKAGPPETPSTPQNTVQSAPARLFPEGASTEVLFAPRNRRSATALAFNPVAPGELWVVLRQFPLDAPCTSEVSTGCSALRGQVAVIANADTDAPESTIKEDANSWHFMRRPTCIAFSENGNFATCAEARTGNYEDEKFDGKLIDYAGPTLWSSDPAIFGVTPEPGQNGRHLDMLHETPFCMGIAHEKEHAFWTFNGKLGALDRYDFREPHPIGGEDHSDGELRRYAEGELLRVAEVPSHLVLDKVARRLYVADTGHSRVVRLDIDSGSASPIPNSEMLEPMALHERVEGATLETFVPEGVLTRPSGIALYEDLLIVGDSADGTIHAFDLEDAHEVASLATGLPEGALGGITVGPDQRLYFTSLASGEVHRVHAP